MADKVVLDNGGKERVAVEMAATILISMEDKSWNKITRDEYLKTVVQCIRALGGLNP